ncbi:hypothetical protein DICPUDRAFT_151725 [Dictyostelium purpureum]|uniref:Transmembrane protein n=1 Tax=Dictyostelium purpureum TaxID=5786 RepID=F0ZJM1_DICPU|nr:uncharacterized protein DICPUDRAFT_151725 [Dictyostelium purpureum]EGC35885.1 hypothetical protein DICPUDRAFT_151725 [Dictyostelium purpureum]|eukprot:XP_003287616.1 hypothetical protein DICPUDRAFT_151725 [Dictyostelium purpureum]
MNKSNILLLLFITLVSSLLIVGVQSEDFDPTKWARFDVYCKSECGESEHRTITLSVGSCQSFADHCGDKPSIQVMTTYNPTTEEYTFTGSPASDAQCSTIVQQAQNVSMYQCFTLLDYFEGHHELTSSSISIHQTTAVFLILISILISLII